MVVLSVAPMVSVTQAMHRVMVGPVCVVGDAFGTGRGGPERGLPLVQRAMVALVMPVVRVLQVMDRVTVWLVMSMAGWGVGEAVRAGGEGVACGAMADGEGAVGGAVGGGVARDADGEGAVGDSDGEGVAGDAMADGVVDDVGGEGAAGVVTGDGDVGRVHGGYVVGDATGSGAAGDSDDGEGAAMHWGRCWRCRWWGCCR